MFKVYSKLLKYVPEKKYLAYIAILLSVISAFATAGAYYYLFLFLNNKINIFLIFIFNFKSVDLFK